MSENCIDCPPSVTISLQSNSSSLKGALSGQRYFLATESPLKMMKNDFYFTFKALFFLSIFKFLYWVFGHVGKWLYQKDMVNFKIYDVTTWLKIIAVHILTNISRSKDNQAMESGHLIEYKLRNIFLEKLYTKCVGETITRPFSKKSKLNISLDQLRTIESN